MSATSSSSWIGRHSQPLVPAAHRAGASVAPAHITGPLGLPIQFLVELVELTEEHKEHHLLRQDTGREQRFLSLTRSNRFTMKFTAPSRRKHMKYTTTNVGLADANTGGGC